MRRLPGRWVTNPIFWRSQTFEYTAFRDLDVSAAIAAQLAAINEPVIHARRLAAVQKMSSGKQA
jgi:hypothetical protein